MRIKQNLTLLSITILLLSSCKFKDDLYVKWTKYRVGKDSTKVMVKTIMRDKITCKLRPDTFELNKQLLYGTWNDSIEWTLSDTCWIGIEHIDKNIKMEFFPSGKFIWEETNAKEPKFNDKYQGEFHPYNQNGYNYITFFFNGKGDTIFHHGDTSWGFQYFIYNIDSNHMRLRECFPEDNYYMDEILDFVKD